jgi:two-component system, cell cycle sensor histidine kinase and response regulator CckA
MATGNSGTGRKRKPDPLAGMWEQIFRTAQVPIYIEDITQIRRSIREVLAGDIEDFGNWLDAHPEFIISTIKTLKILDVNDKAVEAAGARDADHLMSSLDRMIVPETLKSFKDILMALAAEDEFYKGESQIQTLDGRSMITLNTAILPQGKSTGRDIVVLVTNDITDLKSAEKKLQDSEERYRVLVETAQDIILCHDLSGQILFTNQAGLELTGWSTDELYQKTLHDLVPKRLQGELDQRLEQRTNGFAGTFLFEILVLDCEGREIPVEICSTRIPGKYPETPQIIAIIRDVSERKALESRVLNTQKMESLGALAGGIAHDFNNLLATIMGNAELMKGDRRLGDEFTENLASILEASNQAADLCQQMLAYSGKGQFSVDSSDLSEVINDVSRLFQATVTGHARLNFQLTENLAPVMIDTAPIRQVIMGLVSNAAESLSDEGGEVVIRTGCCEFTSEQLEGHQCTPMLEAGTYVYCEVADSGAGMDAETQRRLFDPFYSTKFMGRGLGLSTAMGIIKGHNGAFLVDTAPGLGSTVSFLLPKAPVEVVKKPQKRRKKAPDTLHLDLAGKLVLLVDEDLPVRKVCESFLRRLGCSVLSVGNGPDAVRVFSQRYDEVDLAILDLGMADMDGVATFRRLRVIHPEISVIFSTGSGEEELHDRAKGIGNYGYIAKPFKLANVRQALGLALGKPAG